MAYKPSQWSAMRIAQKKIHLMHLQERTGVLFNRPFAEQLVEQIDKQMDEIAQEIEPQLPARLISPSQTKQPPAKQFKMNGEPTSYTMKYFPNLRKEGSKWLFDHPETYEVCSLPWHEPIHTKTRMTMANQKDIKDWLLSQGWSPTFWNFQKDSDGKPVRDDRGKLIQTSPKMQEAGTLCPNLEAMEGELVSKIVKWLSMRNRRSVLKASDDNKETGWLNHPRLDIDGRLPATWSQVAKSHRIQHKTVCNVPKAAPEVLLGHEMRSMFIVPEWNKAVGYDASGLEARVMAHFTIPFDDGEFANLLLEGDIHSYTAKGTFARQLEKFDIYADDFDKDDPEFKPWRNKAKAILYASIYGASAPKIAKMVGVSAGEGEQIFKRFWETNWALSKLRDNLLEHWTKRGKKSIINPISGAIIPATKPHAVLNYLFQNTGAFVMDVSNHFMDSWLGDVVFDDALRPSYLLDGYRVARTVYYHDETLWEAEEPIADKLGQLGVKSIERTGKVLGFRLPLTGEYKVGDSWADVH